MRQLLVSMSGREPDTWLDWHEKRKILRDRSDSAIIAARVPPAPPARPRAAARVAQSASCVGSC